MSVFRFSVQISPLAVPIHRESRVLGINMTVMNQKEHIGNTQIVDGISPCTNAYFSNVFRALTEIAEKISSVSANIIIVPGR
jgi:hypothetical protein